MRWAFTASARSCESLRFAWAEPVESVCPSIRDGRRPLVLQRGRDLAELLLGDRQEIGLARGEEHRAGERDDHAALLLLHRGDLLEARERRVRDALGLPPRRLGLLAALLGRGARALGLLPRALGLLLRGLGLGAREPLPLDLLLAAVQRVPRAGELLLREVLEGALGRDLVALRLQQRRRRLGLLGLAVGDVREIARLRGLGVLPERPLGAGERLLRRVELGGREARGGAFRRAPVARAGVDELLRWDRRAAPRRRVERGAQGESTGQTRTGSSPGKP